MTSRLRSLWRNLVHGQRVERDLEDEVRGTFELLVEEKIERGVQPAAARTEAAREMGRLESIKEQVREVRNGAGIETLWHDVRFGVRLLRRTPSFAAAAIISLALGIGANSAVFGLLNAIRLRSLPVPRAGELAEIRLDGPRCCRHTGRNRQLSLPLLREIMQRQEAFSALFAFSDTRFNLAPRGEVKFVEGLFVSGEFFPVLGVAPLLGRTLNAADDRPGCVNPGAVISHALWQSEFGGRDDVLTRSITLRAAQHPIVGVMPPRFFGVEVGRRFEVALPLCASGFGRHDHWWLAAIGRLKPGWTAGQASAHLAALGPSLLQAAVPPNYDAEGARQFAGLQLSVRSAKTGVSPLRTQYEEPLWLLLAIAVLVLVAACANVGSLSLVRLTARQPELAVRFALGASKLRVVRQLLVEGLLIAVTGAAAGLVLARLVHDGVLALISTQVDPIRLEAGLDWRLLGFTAAVVGLTTVAFAVAPAIRVIRGRSNMLAGARVTHSRGQVLAREVLVAVQVAMAVVLVSGAMLFIMTSRNLVSADTGFSRDGLLVANVFLPEEHYPPAGRAAVQRELTARFSAIPGMAGAAHATTPPLGGSTWGTIVRVPAAGGDVKREVIRNQVSARYFAVMGTSFLAGRDFNEHDTPASPKVAIVNEAFARELFGEPRPLGRRFADGNDEFTVVGIVRDSKQYSLREEFRSITYTAASQVAEPSTTMRFVLRSETGMGQTIESVRQVLGEVTPTAGVRFATADDMVSTAAHGERLMASLAGLFGAIALVLAVVGVYGVVAYTAASRRREIGIRLALGARARDVLRAVLRRVVIVIGAGMTAGLVLALSASGMASSLLYGVKPADPQVLAFILAVIIGAALLAIAMPARRALRTDPVIALKTE